MSEYRYNRWMDEWVIVAPQRGARPHEMGAPPGRRAAAPYVPSCPFCPGNEAETPPALVTVPADARSGGWQIRIFPNKYPALALDAARPASPVAAAEVSGAPFRAEPGAGAHEVLVETPRHDGVPASWTDAQAAGIVSACRDRYRTLAARPEIRYVLVFRNHGERAGTSLEHPHSQIIATSVLPETVRRRREIAREYRRRTGTCLLCRLAEEEIEARVRVVSRDRDFAVFHPFAAARPAETWIVPLAHAPSFDALDDATLPRFAVVLRDVLRRLQIAFDDPDFNYVIHSDSPGDDAAAADLHWFVRVVPQLSRTAGFELGAGVYINTEPPEETAERMRSAAV